MISSARVDVRLIDDKIYNLIVDTAKNGTLHTRLDDLAEKANCCKRTAIRASDRLSAAGLITHQSAGRNGIVYQVMSYDESKRMG